MRCISESSWRWIAIAIAICSALMMNACGDGGLEHLTIDSGRDVIAADVDGDQRLDVVTLVHQFGDQPQQGLLTVHRQTSRGLFAPAERYVIGCYPWSMVLADVDGDTRPDLLVVDVSYTNCNDPTAREALYLLRQDPTRPGRFLAPQKLTDDVYSYHAAVADLDGDGAPDIAYGQRVGGEPRLAILYQDATRRGNFQPPVAVVTPRDIFQIVAGDVDGDGRADLLFTDADRASGDPATVWLTTMTQTDRGTLGDPTRLSSYAGVRADFLAIQDLDSDGRADLLAYLTPTSALRDDHPSLRSLRQGPAAMEWSAPIGLDLAPLEGKGIGATALGDLNQDGRPDVVLAGTWPESGGPLAAPNIRARVNLAFGQGDARFAYVGAIDVEPWPDAVTIGDLDGDGRNDIVINAEGVAWWMPQSATMPGSFGAPQPLP